MLKMNAFKGKMMIRCIYICFTTFSTFYTDSYNSVQFTIYDSQLGFPIYDSIHDLTTMNFPISYKKN